MCEYQFFDLDPIFKLISTPTFASRLDLSQIPESAFVPIPFELKSIIFHNHTSLLDKSVEQNNFKIIFENWKLDGNYFFNKIIHFYKILIGCIREVTGGFLRDPQSLDWAAFRGPIRPPPEQPPWGNFSFSFHLFHA